MRLIILAIAGIFVFSQIALLIQPAEAATASVSNEAELVAALADSNNDTINLSSSFSTTAEIVVDRSVIINGNGNTISPTFSGSGGNNSVLEIFDTDSVTINDLTIDGATGTSLHGVNIYVVTNVLLNSLTSTDNDKSGIVVNGSTVTVNNVTTEGNTWHGINVDLGGGVTEPAVLTINGMSDQTDVLHVYSDSYATKDVTINDTNSQYFIVENVLKGGDRLYQLNPIGEITSPNSGEVVAGTIDLIANYEDWDGGVDDDAVQWAVREGTCAAGTDTVLGNVDGFSDTFAWDGADFSASLDTTGLNDGMHCFVFNPTDDAGENNVRETREFIVDNTDPEQVLGMTIFQNGSEIGCSAAVEERLITVDWDDSTDPNFSHYMYQADDGVAPIDFTTTVVPSERTGQIRDEDGTYMYRARAVDEAGNQGEWSVWCTVTLDREPPIVDITSPLDGAVLSGLVDIVASVTDNLELSHYNLSLYPSTTDLSDGGTHSGDRLNDSDWCTIPISGTVVTSADVIGDLCTDWDTTQYVNGEYQIRLAARDATGLRDLSDPFNGGTSSVHVIAVTIDNGEGGQTLGATDDRTDDQQVLGVTDEGAVLAATGQGGWLMSALGSVIMGLALATRLVRIKEKNV